MRLPPFFYFLESPGKALYGFVAQFSVTPRCCFWQYILPRHSPLARQTQNISKDHPGGEGGAELGTN